MSLQLKSRTPLKPPLATAPPPAPVAVVPVKAKSRRPRSRRAILASLTPDAIFNSRWFISQAAGDALALEYLLYLQGRKIGASWDDDDEQDDDKDKEDDPEWYDITDDGIACIPIRGTLVKSDYSFAYPFATSYACVAEMCTDAMARASVKGLLLCVDSGGGMASGMFDCANCITSLRGTKPIVAIADDAAYSAAYALASSADKIFCTQTGGVGSIGCWMAHQNIAKMLENVGISVTMIYSGEKKVDGNPLGPLPDAVKAEWQTEADRMRSMFVSTVAKNRAVASDDLMATEAGIYMAGASLPLLADMIGTRNNALDYLRLQIAAAGTVDDPQGSADDTPGDRDTPFGQAAASNIPIVPTYTLTYLTTDGQTHTLSVVGVTGDRLAGFPDVQAGAIGYQKTATSDKSWDGPAAKTNLKLDQPGSYYRKAFAWVDGSADATKKGSYRYLHHEVSSGGDIGAANVTACRSGIGVLNGARGGTTIPSGDRKGVYNHLAHHLRDAGVDPPPLKSEAEVAAMLYLEDSHGECYGYDVPDIGSIRVEAVRADGTSTMLNGDGSGYWAGRKARRVSMLSGLQSLKLQHPNAIAAVRSFERRASVGSGRKISLLAAPYGGVAQLSGMKEVYRKGCFQNGLGGDLRILWNHADSQMWVLGRTSAGTARFFDTDEGLRAEADAPETQWATDLIVSMRRGDINEASLGFWILEASYENRADGRYRVIEKAMVHDASVESWGAYSQATATVQPESQQASSHDDKRSRLAILRRRVI